MLGSTADTVLDRHRRDESDAHTLPLGLKTGLAAVQRQTSNPHDNVTSNVNHTEPQRSRTETARPAKIVGFMFFGLL